MNESAEIFLNVNVQDTSKVILWSRKQHSEDINKGIIAYVLGKYHMTSYIRMTCGSVERLVPAFVPKISNKQLNIF